MRSDALKKLEDDAAECAQVIEASKETIDDLITRVERMFMVRDGWSRLGTQGLQ